MTPYRKNGKKTESGADGSVQSVSLFEFVEELLRKPEPPVAKRKKAARK